MKHHGNYHTIEDNKDFYEHIGDYASEEYANQLIEKAKIHAKNNKRHSVKNKKRIYKK